MAINRRDNDLQRVFTRRALLLGTAQLALFGALAGRLEGSEAWGVEDDAGRDRRRRVVNDDDDMFAFGRRVERRGDRQGAALEPEGARDADDEADDRGCESVLTHA
ncbi:MAG: hypothetical protein VW600_19780 [Ferrovibrio sp.]